jgi:hypothetical protein
MPSLSVNEPLMRKILRNLKDYIRARRHAPVTLLADRLYCSRVSESARFRDAFCFSMRICPIFIVRVSVRAGRFAFLALPSPQWHAG